jgi:hypothetical protein
MLSSVAKRRTMNTLVWQEELHVVLELNSPLPDAIFLGVEMCKIEVNSHYEVPNLHAK